MLFLKFHVLHFDTLICFMIDRIRLTMFNLNNITIDVYDTMFNILKRVPGREKYQGC